MSLSFKYWVEFDEEGGIKALHKSKYECEDECKEYLIKLIPIKRDHLVEKSEKISKELESSTNKLKVETKRFETELSKTIKAMKGFK